MNFVLIALVAALRVAGASSAYTTGTLTTVTTDTVPIALPGGEWATAQFITSSAGTATATAQVSIDGGTNWIPSAYCKRLTTVSANPTVQAITATTLVAADTWECPLPGNATHFRLQCGGTGTTTSVQVSGGAPYVPGVEVKATLADTTEGSIGAGIAATVFDLSGWNTATINFTVPTTQVWTARFLDSAGASVVPAITTTAAGSSVLTIAPGGQSLATLTLASNTINVVGVVWPRVSLTLPAGGTVSTGRAVVVVRR